MKIIHLLVAASCLLEFTAIAQEEGDPFAAPDGSEVIENSRLIRSQVEYVEMSHKDLTRLMMEDKSPTADATALRMKVQAIVDKGEAKIIETQIVVGMSGRKQASESVHEVTYPTEYEPVRRMPTPAGNGESEPAISEVSCISVRPVAFETRKVGSTMETEPTLGEDDRTIDIRIYPTLTWYTGDTVFNEMKDELGNVTKVTFPNFYVIELNTNFICLSGQYVLACVVSPKDAKGAVDPDRKVMVFAKCDVLEVK